jgi:prepilin-type N-terminal cleavage/methylation domain-containing protein
MQTKLRQSGFTLVEIAIVLVIIGLLLGGILKGQEMITQARIKNVVNDFNGITAAYFSYQDRYKAVPGDDGQAGARWNGTYGAKNGNANGVLAGAYNDTPETPNAPGTPGTATSETTNFWQHLRISGFVAGPNQGAGSTAQPVNAVGGQIGVQNGGMTLPGLVVCSANIPDKIATAVDTQLDDQRSNAGSMRAMDQAGVPNPAVVTQATGYVEDGTKQYLLCKSV